MGDGAAKVWIWEHCRNGLETRLANRVSRRKILKWGALCTLAGAVPLGLAHGCARLRPGKPRHVILISMDTLRRDHLPVYGYDRQTAPYIAELAASSVVFDNAIAATSNTAPSHASILTGLYPLSHGIPYNWAMLSQDIPTLGEILLGQGFSTAAFVSCVALHSQITGLNKGFEVYRQVGPSPGHCRAADTFGAAAQWLESVKTGQPVFLFFHVFDPHFPYSAPLGQTQTGWASTRIGKSLPLDYPAMRARMLQGFQPDEIQTYVDWYDAEILYADLYVGRLLKILRDKGIYDDSLIIFLSDHGETLGERPWMFDHGCRVFEEQIQVPMIIRFPGAWGQGARVGASAHHVDITPTVLDALGLPPPKSMEGVSLLPVIKQPGGGGDRFQITMARSDPERSPDLKDAMAAREPVYSIRNYPHKLLVYPGLDGSPIMRLHDLEADPGEKRNIAREQPAVAGDLKKRLDIWISHCGTNNKKFRETPLPPDMDRALRSLGYIG